MRAVPFGAPGEVNEAQRKICMTAARVANQRIRREFLAQDNSLTRALRQQKKQSLLTMQRQWSPMQADWHYGLTLKVRDSDVKWLVKEEYADWLQDVVTDAMTEAILTHREDWIAPMLNDALVSELPYYRMDDMPSRVQRLWNRLRRHHG